MQQKRYSRLFDHAAVLPLSRDTTRQYPSMIPEAWRLIHPTGIRQCNLESSLRPMELLHGHGQSILAWSAQNAVRRSLRQRYTRVEQCEMGDRPQNLFRTSLFY